jgi:hypothetical protein
MLVAVAFIILIFAGYSFSLNKERSIESEFSMDLFEEQIRSIDIVSTQNDEVKIISLKEEKEVHDYLKILSDSRFTNKDISYKDNKEDIQSYAVSLTSYKRGTTFHLTVDHAGGFYFDAGGKMKNSGKNYRLVDQLLFEATAKIMKENMIE